MSTNGYNFTGAKKTAALKNFVNNMVSTRPIGCITYWMAYDAGRAAGGPPRQQNEMAGMPQEEFAPSRDSSLRTSPPHPPSSGQGVHDQHQPCRRILGLREQVLTLELHRGRIDLSSQTSNLLSHGEDISCIPAFLPVPLWRPTWQVVGRGISRQPSPT